MTKKQRHPFVQQARADALAQQLADAGNVAAEAERLRLQLQGARADAAGAAKLADDAAALRAENARLSAQVGGVCLSVERACVCVCGLVCLPLCKGHVLVCLRTYVHVRCRCSRLPGCCRSLRDVNIPTPGRLPTLTLKSRMRRR